MKLFKGLFATLFALQAFSFSPQMPVTNETLEFVDSIEKVAGELYGEKTYVESESINKANYDKIYFRNKCYETIYAALTYQNLNENWETAGWYKLAPGQKGYLQDTRNRFFYIYAESDTMSWAGSDTYEYVNGRGPFGFRKIRITTDDWGMWTQNFTCN